MYIYIYILDIYIYIYIYVDIYTYIYVYMYENFFRKGEEFAFPYPWERFFKIRYRSYRMYILTFT